MLKFPSFKPKAPEAPRHERYNQENIEAFKQSIIAGLDMAAFDDLRNTAGDKNESTCPIPVRNDEAGKHAEEVLRTLLGSNEAVWFKSNLQTWFVETLGRVPELRPNGELHVSWDSLSLHANHRDREIPRTLGGDPMNGDE